MFYVYSSCTSIVKKANLTKASVSSKYRVEPKSIKSNDDVVN